VEANGSLGLAFNELGDYENALLCFKKSQELIRGKNPVNPLHKSFLTVSKAKIEHDIDQFKYLAELGYDVQKFQALAELYRNISLEIDWSGREIKLLSDGHQKLLKETYNRIIYLLDAPKLDNGALSGAFESEKITNSYFQHDHGLTYIDNFLSSTALDSIRKFLLEVFDCNNYSNENYQIS
jgi:hypothetical protein